MERLNGIDSGFLNLETPVDHMHQGALLILDRGDEADAASLDHLQRMIDERLHLVPALRRRVVDVPFGIDHPYWIEDPDFDLDFHIRHIAVPPPGGRVQLSRLIGRLFANRLHRDRPLWEVYLIDGLAQNRAAVLVKAHHAAVDPASGAELLATMLDFQANPTKVGPGRRPWLPDRVPGAAEMMVRGMLSLARNPLRVIEATPRVLANAFNLQRSMMAPKGPAPQTPFSAPRSPFNGALTPHRTTAWASLDLQTVRSLKNALECTVNDVVLAVVTGAARRYLLAQKKPVEAPLIALVPISVRAGSRWGEAEMHIAPLFAPLPVQTRNPLRRVAAIVEATRGTREVQDAIGADLLRDITQFAPPALAASAARMYGRLRIADRVRPLFNLIVTNVPGPPMPLYLAGARVVHYYPLGSIYHAAGLSLSVQSLEERLDVGLVACREILPDPWPLADALPEALAELDTAVRDRAARQQATSAARSRRASVAQQRRRPATRRRTSAT